jgi:F-type H+-transporting ATPase subunit b
VKDKLFWVLAFVVFAGLAFLVDHGETKLGVPVWFWLALNLTVFLYLLNRLVGRPINEGLENRGKEIKEQLAQARDKLAEAEKLRGEVRDRLDKVEAEVKEMAARAETQGRNEAEKIDLQASEDEARFMRRVEDQITRQRAETRQQLAKDTAALTAQLTKELLAKSMTGEDQERVLARSLDALADLKDKE